MNTLKVLISILNWNNWDNTVKAVNSVLQSDYTNYKIIILDNNSVDDSYKKLKAAFPGIEVWQLKSNFGYAGAHKKAALFAIENNFDLVWILNNDIQVFPFTLTELIKAYERNGNVLLGSVSLEADGETIHFGGGAELINNYTADETIKYNQYAGKNYFSTAMKERTVSDIEGASFVIPVSVIKQHGFIETSYFLYGEETDYCYTIRTKYNIQSIVVPAARIIHRASDSFKISPGLEYIKAYYFTRNIHLLYKKFYKNYRIEGNGGILHLLKFFFKHYVSIKKKDKYHDYWIKYYTKLGYLHALIRLRGKYLEPNKFLN